MEKTVIILPDGRQIASGTPGQTAMQSCTLTQCVNAGTELTLGSVCAAMVELRLLVPEQTLPIAAGEELQVYRGRKKLGIFIAEKPVRTGSHTASVTAYDRISLLDKDLTLWLESLTQWPYSLQALATHVCHVCGLQLANIQIPNGSILVEKFAIQGVTGRKLIQWIAESAGCFCRATAEGQLEFAWYTPAGTGVGPCKTGALWRYAGGALAVQDLGITANAEGTALRLDAPRWTVTEMPSGVQITAAGQQFYFGGSLSYEDYAVAPIQKVQIGQSDADVGAIYPDDPAAVNTYRITGNPLLAGLSAQALEAVAQSLYARLKDFSYTPCRLALPGETDLEAGQLLTITDQNGRCIQSCIMTKKQTGQKLTLESTGSPSRQSVTAVNEQSYTALSGKVLNLHADVDGIKAENKDAAGALAALTLSVEGLSAQAEKQTADADSLRTELTKVQQTANAVKIAVQTITEQGAAKVQTNMGYTFDDAGLQIARQGAQIRNRLDNTGMFVSRGDEVILQADSDGVRAVDVAVGNYLTVGHSRLESYEGNRTACFYIGG